MVSDRNSFSLDPMGQDGIIASNDSDEDLWTEGNMQPENLLRMGEGIVPGEWIDYNGHMSEAYYILAMGIATDGLMEMIGLGRDHRETAKTTIYTMESHVVYLLEIRQGAPYYVTTQLLGHDDKRMHIFHAMWHGDSNELLCTLEQLWLHVDMTGPRAVPFQPHSLTSLRDLANRHDGLPRPRQTSAAISLPRR